MNHERLNPAAAVLLFATSAPVALAEWEIYPRMSLEYVTGDSTENLNVGNGAKLAEIQGNLDNVLRLDLGVTLKPIDWVRLNLDYAFKVDQGDLHASEYYWLRGFASWTDANFYENANIDQSSRLDLSADFALYRADQILLTAGFGYRDDQLEWGAGDGTFISSSSSGFHDVSGSIPANAGISVDQSHSTFYLSLGAEAQYDSLVFGGRFLYGPLSKLNSKTTYSTPVGFPAYLPYGTIDQNFDDTTMIGAEVGVKYRYSGRLGFSLDYAYTKYDRTDGQMFIAGADIAGVLGDTVEGTFESHDSVVSLGVSYRFP